MYFVTHEMVLMCGHNICFFNGNFWKVIPKSSLLLFLIWSTESWSLLLASFLDIV